jgi:hypothetical protein
LFGLSKFVDRQWAVFPTSFAGEFEKHVGFGRVLDWIGETMRSAASKERTMWRKSIKSGTPVDLV